MVQFAMNMEKYKSLIQSYLPGYKMKEISIRRLGEDKEKSEGRRKGSVLQWKCD